MLCVMFWGEENKPKVFRLEFFQELHVRTQFPGTPSCLKQKKKAPRAKFLSGKEKTKQKTKFGGLSRDWVGGESLFMCFLSHSLWGRKTQKQNPQNIPGESCEN